MRVLVANNMDPFVHGGAEELATHLVSNLRRHGHEAELFRMPMRFSKWQDIPSQMAAARSLEIDNVDLLVALKFPTFYLRHESKVIWLLHQYRQVYDMFDAGMSDVPAGGIGDEFRALVTIADSKALSEAKSIYTNSSVTGDRLLKYNGFESKVLLPPLNDAHLFGGGESQGYIFAGGRVNSTKRQSMLIEALALTPSKVRLVIAGPPDSRSAIPEMRKLAERLGVSDRLQLDLRFLEREELASLVNSSAACAYIPFDEDSLGYVSMEAAEARKPIISCVDSGGVTQLVRRRNTGWLCEPNPESLASAMTDAIAHPEKAKAFGRGAFNLWRSFGVNWDQTIEMLVAK